MAGHTPWRSSAGRSSARPGGSDAGASGGFSMSSTGTSIVRSSRGFSPASTMATGRGWPSMLPPRKRAIASSGRCVADSPMRCGSRPVSSTEPLEREHEVRAALARRQRVDLVDDDGVDRRQDRARLRREQQIERLGRGDEDVARRARELPPLLLGRVAGADADADRAQPRAERLGGARDAGQRRAQVALDVVGERLERRDVQDAHARLGRRRQLASRDRGRRGTRRASCRCRSAPAAACARRARCAASRAPAPASARRRRRRTRRGSPGRTPRAAACHPFGPQSINDVSERAPPLERVGLIEPRGACRVARRRAGRRAAARA